jgi:hypothetical protein
MLTEFQLERLSNFGYVIIDNFLPINFHDKLLKELMNTSSKIHYQIRSGHYNHVFHSDITTLPQGNESYIAKFRMLENRQLLPNLNVFFNDFIKPILKEGSKNEAKFSLFPSAVRLESGDTYRAHQDSYAGIVGFSYFINPGWRWDYGGILTYINGATTAEPIFPLTNRLLLRNETVKKFHYLNTIEQYALNEQYIILGWADKTQGEESEVRGKYIPI